MSTTITAFCEEFNGDNNLLFTTRGATVGLGISVGPSLQKPNHRGRVGAGGPQLANPGIWRAAAMRLSPALNSRRKLHRARSPV
eukprot:850164-Heterocapsa_arctica.AAC.1